MANLPTSRTFENYREWESAWGRLSMPRLRQSSTAFAELSGYIGGALSLAGFRLFRNGGTPLLERRRGTFREEIVIVPAPGMYFREGLPFGVRVHLSSTEVARIRSRYWRPSTRAPQVVATGDIGQLRSWPRWTIWYASIGLETAESLVRELTEHAVPWFETFESPTQLRDKLYARELPLVDSSTALELLLAEFDPFEARRYLATCPPSAWFKSGPVAEPEGYRLGAARLGPISAYYRLW